MSLWFQSVALPNEVTSCKTGPLRWSENQRLAAWKRKKNAKRDISFWKHCATLTSVCENTPAQMWHFFESKYELFLLCHTNIPHTQTFVCSVCLWAQQQFQAEWECFHMDGCKIGVHDCGNSSGKKQSWLAKESLAPAVCHWHFKKFWKCISQLCVKSKHQHPTLLLLYLKIRPHLSGWGAVWWLISDAWLAVCRKSSEIHHILPWFIPLPFISLTHKHTKGPMMSWKNDKSAIRCGISQ